MCNSFGTVVKYIMTSSALASPHNFFMPEDCHACTQTRTLLNAVCTLYDHAHAHVNSPDRCILGAHTEWGISRVPLTAHVARM